MVLDNLDMCSVGAILKKSLQSYVKSFYLPNIPCENVSIIRCF